METNIYIKKYTFRNNFWVYQPKSTLIESFEWSLRKPTNSHSYEMKVNGARMEKPKQKSSKNNIDMGK